MKNLPLLCAVSVCSLPFYVNANVQSTPDNDAANIEVISVKSVRQKLSEAGRLKDVIQQTELLDELMIKNKNALSLSEAINNEPGVNVSNECSMCGVKRVMLNGMKGEHTTILVDGIPTHTLISGFYAVDAIATTGVDRIEIARGAGASLIAPEAIGGTVNIVTKQATSNGVSFDLAKGSHDFTALKGAATGVSEDGKTGINLIMQPNCSWRKKQAIDLEKLAATCKDTLNTSVLGFNGKRNEFRRESRYFADKVPVFAADKQIIRTLGGVTTSPTFIFLNKQGQIVAKQQGYLPPEKLYNAVNILSNAQCKLTS